MFRLFVFVACVAVLLASTAALAPATLMNPLLENASRGKLSLAEAEGTLWNGRGILGVSTAAHLPVAWRFDPWPLLKGEAHVTLVPPTPLGNAPRADILARPGAITVQTVDATLPAEVVTALTTPAVVKLAGVVHVTSPSLEWTRTSLAGSARLDWIDAQFAISNDAGIRLGNVTANLTAAGDQLTGPVTNEGGDFDVRGTVSLRTTGVPEAMLTMTPRTGDPAQARSLSVNARPDGSGLNVQFRAGPR